MNSKNNSTAPQPGTLYGIGVGPGSPDLLTLRAVSALGRVDVVLTPASPRNDYSTAFNIARPHINPNVQIVRLDFPMTCEQVTLDAAWETAAKTTAEILASGKSAAFLTIGDPLVYSTFGYLMSTLRQTQPEAHVEIIPGITSFQAAAAQTGTILCQGRENLMVLPGINNREALEDGLRPENSVVILKAYRNFPAIREALEHCDRLESSMLVSRIGLDGETVTPNLRAADDKPTYLSLVLAPKNRKGRST